VQVVDGGEAAQQLTGRRREGAKSLHPASGAATGHPQRVAERL